MVDDFMLRGWKISHSRPHAVGLGTKQRAFIEKQSPTLDAQVLGCARLDSEPTSWYAVDERMSTISFAFYLLGS